MGSKVPFKIFGFIHALTMERCASKMTVCYIQEFLHCKTLKQKDAKNASSEHV